MSQFVYTLASCVLISLAFSCSEIDTCLIGSHSPLPGRFAGLEFYMDTTQDNQFKADRFCQEWEFVSTQVEVWVDGELTETRDADNVFPYLSLSFCPDGAMAAQGMSGTWHYAYNYLMIDVSQTGGSIYWYEVKSLTHNKMVLREEDYRIGGPIVTFRQNPAGMHYFWLFTYEKK